jgi:hypothetical protein
VILLGFWYNVNVLYQEAKTMKHVEKILSVLEAEPEATYKKIGEAIGVSSQRAQQICKAQNIKTCKIRGRRPANPHTQWRNRYGGTEKIASHFVGGASEITAAAFFMRQGIPTYRAVAFCGRADLVIDVDGKLLAVEVRSAKKNLSGRLCYAVPVDKTRYDILALVEPDGTVTVKDFSSGQ